ncbi:MAG TPA: peptidoglycan DD-metalloendopeptidase family protein [Fibrobacteraceae bacterium]|nr:peptidoglycan DD-metalloendopeptidase family protein [Fibrobacteraceae bacterium]
MARKIEIRIFPETTESSRYHAYPVWRLVVLIMAVLLSITGFLVFDPFSILKKWTDVSLYRMYTQNKNLEKTLSQLQEKSEEARQRLEDNARLRESVVRAAGIPESADKPSEKMETPSFFSTGIGPARNMKRIREAHRNIRAFLDSLRKDTSKARSLPLIYPLRRHSMITARFGLIHDQHTGDDLPHYGTDFTSTEGDTIIAPGDGTIKSIYTDKGFGLCLLLAHSDQVETFYAHLLSSLVRSGQKVTRGQPIALLGSSGRSAGPHLHYEVRVQGHPVNPEDYFLTP